MKKKCNVVMLATQKATKECILLVPQNTGINNNEAWLKLNKNTDEIQNYSVLSPQHLYITSSYEIQEGDYVLINNNKIVKAVTQNGSIGYINGPAFLYLRQDERIVPKIIASTDPELHKDGVAKIDSDFIEDYIVKYNKGDVIKEVNVEYNNRCCGRCDGVHDKCITDMICTEHMKQGCEFCFGSRFYVPKLRLDDTIIIHKVQELFTKEDLFQAYKISNSLGLEEQTLRLEFETWFEQNY